MSACFGWCAPVLVTRLNSPSVLSSGAVRLRAVRERSCEKRMRLARRERDKRRGGERMAADDQGWTDDPAVLLRHQVLTAMGTGETDSVEIAHALTGSPEEVGRVFQHLIAQGLAKGFALRVGDQWPEDAVLTPEGRALVSSMRAARTPGVIKRSCNAAMLAWLDANEGVTIFSTEELHSDVRGHFYGEAIPMTVGHDVARELHKHGLISGSPTGQGPVLRPAITALGRAVHTQHSGDLGTWQAASSGGGTTIHVTGSTGVTVANNSPGAQQSVRVTTDAREQVVNLAAALEQMLPSLGLAPADFASASGLVAELREAAEMVESEPGRARRLVETVKAIAVNGTGSAAGTALVALADQIARNL